MKTLIELDPKKRQVLAQKILSVLREAAKDSTTHLRGSLAAGNADRYSDIDVLWVIPDELFAPTLNQLREILTRIRPVEWLRFAPEFQNSDRRRLAFIQFCNLPLFWRADLEIFAQSVQHNPEYDIDNPAAKGNEWSATHSALMNAIAAIKAILRNEDHKAELLILRGYQKVRMDVPPERPHNQILKLVEEIAALDPTLCELSDRIKYLYQQVFD